MAGTTNFKGITIQLDIDSNDFDSKLKKSNRAVDDFDRQLKKLDEALKLNPKNMDAINARIDLVKEKTVQLTNNIHQFEKALSDLKADGVETTDKRFIDVVTSLQKARSELAKYNEEMARLENIDLSDIHLFFGTESFDARFSKLSGALANYESKIKDVTDAIRNSNGAYDTFNTKQKLSQEYQKYLAHYIRELESVMIDMREKGINPTSDAYVKYSTALANAKGKLDDITRAEKRRREEVERALEVGERRQRIVENMRIVTNNMLNDFRKKSLELDESVLQTGGFLAPLGDKVSALSGKFKAFSETMRNVSQSFQVVSKSAQALLLGAGGLSTVAVNFEDAFASVKKTVDETNEISYDDLKDSIIEMSKSLPSTASEIAEIVSLAGQLGVPIENVTQFSKAMIDLGNATNLSAEEAGTMIAQFFNVTKGDLTKVENFSSALVRLGNNSATTERDIMELAFRLSGTATSVGFTQQEILGLSTALASAGLKAESAGGSISTVLQKIQKSVSNTNWEEANEDLKVFGELLGISGQAFKTAWNEDSYGTFQKIVLALGTYKDEGGDLIKMLDDLGISTIRTTDNMTRLALASDNLTKYTEMANEAFAEGNDLQEEADKRYAATKSQLKILMNNVKALGIEMGNKMLPIINKFIKKGIDIIDNNKDWIASNTLLIAKTLAFTSAIAPVTKILSGIASAISSVLNGLGTAITIVSGLSTGALAVSGFAIALGGVITYIASFTKEATAMGEKIRETQLALQQYQETSRQNYETINANTATRLSEIDYYKTLAEELFNLVDSNGKVKEGYENRYNYIVNELAQAGIIERDNIDQTIKKQDELKESIDKTIEAQQNEAIMEGATEKYQQAMADKKQAADWLRESWEDVLEAKKVLADYENNDFSKYTLQEYENAKKTLETYQQMEQMSKDSNLIIDNYNAMKRAYDDGDTERLLTLYYQQEYDLMDKKEDEIHEMLKGKMDEILKLRSEMDTDDPMWQDMISATETEFEEMAKAVGLSVDQAYQYVNQYVPSLLDKANAIKGALSAFTGGAVGSIKKGGRYRIPYNASQSGGLGFASGGITSNVTINVNNNGNPISANEVRRWASIINDELGGSF